MSLLILTFLYTGCTTSEISLSSASNRQIIAKYVETPVSVDGKLDDKDWQSTSVYNLALSKDLSAKNFVLKDSGDVRFLWDSTYFYAGIRFYDSNIIAIGKKDQMHHYKYGDLAELFLKPFGKPWYWELYATPMGKKTSFWFPERKKLTVRECGLVVAVHIEGTLNQSGDEDDYWTAEMAMPVKDLSAPDQDFGPEHSWQILLGRYNHDLGLINPERSMIPQLSVTNFHETSEYGLLKLKY